VIWSSLDAPQASRVSRADRAAEAQVRQRSDCGRVPAHDSPGWWHGAGFLRMPARLFRRSRTQAECIKLLYDRLRELWENSRTNPRLKGVIKRPQFSICVLYVDEVSWLAPRPLAPSMHPPRLLLSSCVYLQQQAPPPTFSLASNPTAPFWVSAVRVCMPVVTRQRRPSRAERVCAATTQARRRADQTEPHGCRHRRWISGARGHVNVDIALRPQPLDHHPDSGAA